MRQWDMKPGVASYSAAISASEKGVEWVLPFECFKEMQHWNLKPDGISYSAAISTFEKTAWWPLAFELLQEMIFWCLHPDISTVHSVVRACSVGGDRAVARTVLAFTRRLAADLRGPSRYSCAYARVKARKPHVVGPPAAPCGRLTGNCQVALLVRSAMCRGPLEEPQPSSLDFL